MKNGEPGDNSASRRNFLQTVSLIGATAIGSTYPAEIARAEQTPESTIQVHKAFSSQYDLLDHEEHCSVASSQLNNTGLTLGQQVRIVRSNNEYALYTVSEERDESLPNIVRMGRSGRTRLGNTEPFDGWLSTAVAHPTYTEEEAQANSEFIERLYDDGIHRDLVFCAPHGGMIEEYTDSQADYATKLLSQKGVSSWQCKGWRSGGGAYERWHITSADISPQSFRGLKEIENRGFTHAVSFHGYSGSDVLVGGGAPIELKNEIVLAIQEQLANSAISVRLADDEYDGNDPSNFVNWLTHSGMNGIQLEQSYEARSNHANEIASAVVSVYDREI